MSHKHADFIYLLETLLFCKTEEELAGLGRLSQLPRPKNSRWHGTLKRTCNWESGDPGRDSGSTVSCLCGHSRIYSQVLTPAHAPALAKGSPNIWLTFAWENCFPVVSYTQAAVDGSSSDGQASLGLIFKKW